MKSGTSDRVEFRRCLTSEDFSLAVELTRAYLRQLDLDLAFQNIDRELADFPHMYGAPYGVFLLAFVDGELAGGVGLRRLESEVCEMKRLFVHDGFKGLGLGRRLCLRLIEEARSLGYAGMRLDTLERMTAARTLYRSLGFRKIGPYCYNPDPTAEYLELVLA